MSLEVLLNERHHLLYEIQIIDREIWGLLKKYRTKINPREYKILKMRFYEKKNLEEVGKEIGITRERIRQLEQIAIIKIDNLISTFNNRIEKEEHCKISEARLK